jgi:hypothetical protein
MYIICNLDGKIVECSPNVNDFDESIDNLSKNSNDVFIGCNDETICSEYFAHTNSKAIIINNTIVGLERLPEPTFESEPFVPTPTMEERLKQVEDTLLFLLMGGM